MKASAIIRIIAFSVAIILLSFILLSVIDYNYYFENGRLHSSSMKAFYVPAGTAIEVYASTLHFCPCEVQREGFGCVVALPVGTNIPLEEPSEDPLLFRKNKWIVAHDQNRSLIERGVVPGIDGVNYEIRY